MALSGPIWKLPKKVYVERRVPEPANLPEWQGCYERKDDVCPDLWSAHFSRVRGFERKWDAAVAQAVARGLLHPDKASKRGGGSEYTIDHWRQERGGPFWEGQAPLPVPLYHVSTAKTKVLRKGLMTKDQLRRTRKKEVLGLGGGSSNTISFTTDPHYARTIKEAVLESIKVARGEWGIGDLIEKARKGDKARRPYLADFARIESNSTWQPGDPLPEKLVYGAQGEAVIHSYDLDRRYKNIPACRTEAWYRARKMRPYTTGEGSVWQQGNKDCYFRGIRKLTPDEARARRFDTFKAWLYARQEAGGPDNPVLFGVDPKINARLDPKEIGLFEAEPCRGAWAARQNGEDEWRVSDGRVVRLTRLDGKKIPFRRLSSRCRVPTKANAPLPVRLRTLYMPWPDFYKWTNIFTEPTPLHAVRLFGRYKDAEAYGKTWARDQHTHVNMAQVTVPEAWLRAVDNDWEAADSSFVVEKFLGREVAARNCDDLTEEAGVKKPWELPATPRRDCLRRLLRYGDIPALKGEKDWRGSLRNYGMVKLKQPDGEKMPRFRLGEMRFHPLKVWAWDDEAKGVTASGPGEPWDGDFVKP